MSNEIRIIVAGGRDFDDYDLLSKTLTDYLDKLEPWELDRVLFMSGGARGADRLGEKFAESCSFPFRRFPADWDKHGKSAGYIRNREMAIYAA